MYYVHVLCTLLAMVQCIDIEYSHVNSLVRK